MTKKLTYTLLMITIFFLLPALVFGAFLYKNYIIRHDKGWDILCDPYIVEKNDWVIKLFQRRGQIAEQDFPEFLNIFSRLNPHITDVNRILPGQSILIPLKKLGEDALPGQSSGIVSIPFMTISKLPEIIKKNALKYNVQEGDCVSTIISRNYGSFGTKSYNQGVQLFKLINPNVVNINRIYPGQVINIPNRDLQAKVWYNSIFDDKGKINPNFDTNKIDNVSAKPKITTPSIPSPQIEKPDADSPLHQAAAALNAKLQTKGTYYFPRKEEKDFAVDMSQYPVMELEDGKRLLFCEKDSFTQSDKDAIKTYWKNFKIIPLSFQSDFEHFLDAIFKSDENYNSDNRIVLQDYDLNIKIVANWIISKKQNVESTSQKISHTCIFLAKNKNYAIPTAINRYLNEFDISTKIIYEDNKTLEEKQNGQKPKNKDFFTATSLSYNGGLKSFVRDFANSLGYRFSENIQISFPYAGIQIDALSNLISSEMGKQILVDFGDLYGDAISSIEESGLHIIQLMNNEDWPFVVKKILTALDISYKEQFNFSAIDNSNEFNIFFTLPGIIFQIQHEKSTLVVSSSLHHEITTFLNQTGNHIILVSPGAPVHNTKTITPDINSSLL